MSGTGTLRIIIIVHTSRMHFSDVPPSTFQLTTISDASWSSPPLSSLSAPCLPFMATNRPPPINPHSQSVCHPQGTPRRQYNSCPVLAACSRHSSDWTFAARIYLRSGKESSRSLHSCNIFMHSMAETGCGLSWPHLSANPIFLIPL